MNEEFMNPDETSTEETGTSGSGDEQQNNTANASEGGKTQQSGRSAQDRIRELVEENKRLKSQIQPADKPSPAQQEPQGDKVLSAKVDILYKAPEHLKAQADEIAAYAARHDLPVEDAIAIFDSKSKVSQADVEAANAAKAEAAQSRTGGTANPAARSETVDVKQMSNEELKSQLKAAISSGYKI